MGAVKKQSMWKMIEAGVWVYCELGSIQKKIDGWYFLGKKGYWPDGPFRTMRWAMKAAERKQ